MSKLGLLSILIFFIMIVCLPSSFAANQDVVISKGSGNNSNACTQALQCFDPAQIAISTGDTATWINNDVVGHTVTSGMPSDSNPGGIFDSGLIKSGKTFQFTFSNAGSYSYFCTVHPWMMGEVIVSASLSNAVSSNQTTGTTTPPGAPTGFTAKLMSASEIELLWGPPVNDGGSPITSYVIDQFIDGDWAKLKTLDGGATGYVLIDNPPDTKYTFRVLAINAQGSTASDPVTITTPTSGGGGTVTTNSTSPSGPTTPTETGPNGNSSGIGFIVIILIIVIGIGVVIVMKRKKSQLGGFQAGQPKIKE